MVFVEEQTSVYSSESDSTNTKEESKRTSAKERRKNKLLKKLRCKNPRINWLAQPRYRVEKFNPKPYEPIDLKPPEPLDSDLEEKLEELSQPKGIVLKENKYIYQKLFEDKEKKRMELLKSGRLQKSRNVISNHNDIGTTT